MSGKARKNKRGSQPRMRVVHGSQFDGKPYQIHLEDEDVGIGSSAKIRKGYIMGRIPVVVAVKVFGELLGDTKKQLLFRELHFAREVSLSHRYILAFLGTATLGEQTAIVSLYMKNGNLMEYIKSNPQCDKKTLILQVAEAVEFLHVEKKLVHGDLKCENVLVSDFGDALLADFGLSSFVEKSETLSTTMTSIRKMLTVQFAAPELLGVPEDAGNGNIVDEDDSPIEKKTTQSDVYAFGMLILQAVSEKPPWGKKNQTAVIRSLWAGQCPSRPTLDGTFVAISHSWWEICRKCWNFKACKRPNITDLIRTLKVSRPEPRQALPVQGTLMTAAFMPDGKTIVAASEDSILLFNTTSGQIRNLWHPGKANAHGRTVGLALSPDRRHIAYFSRQTVEILDATSGLSLMSLEHENWVSCVAYSRDGTCIACGTADGTLHLWDAATGVAVGRHAEGHKWEITDVSFSPDGVCLASASYDGTIRLWDSATCTPTETLDLPDLADCVYSMEFSPDGMHIAAGGKDGAVIIWDVRARRTAHRVRAGWAAILSVAFSPSGHYVAASGSRGALGIWDVRDGKQLGSPSSAPDEAILSVAFSPDGKSLVSTAEDGVICAWDLFD